LNILHISDIHFGPRHWEGNDKILLEKLNSYEADIVINTGDNTTDGLENEYQDVSDFLKSITCKNVISIVGNHDKRNMRGSEFFKKYIYNPEIIYPLDVGSCRKENIILDRRITKLSDNFTDINFTETVSVSGSSVLIVSIDTTQLYSDYGYVDEEILRSASHALKQLTYEKALLLVHYSILGTDAHPLHNPLRLIDFVREHNIEHVFCGHTHEMELRRSTDLYYGTTFTQYMCGSLSSCNNTNESNMFLYYEDFDEENMRIHLVRITIEGDQLIFNDEIISGVQRKHR
jgi:3',5'-cyclic AMP phosphodiesterase CpdA